MNKRNTVRDIIITFHSPPLSPVAVAFQVSAAQASQECAFSPVCPIEVLMQFLCLNWLQFVSTYGCPSQLVSKRKVGIVLVIVQLYMKWNRLSKIIYRRFAVTIDIFWQLIFSCRPSSFLPPLPTSQFLPCKQQKYIWESEKVMNQTFEVLFNWPQVDI